MREQGVGCDRERGRGRERQTKRVGEERREANVSMPYKMYKNTTM